MEVYDSKQLLEELRRITQLLGRQNELLYAILEMQHQIRDEVKRAGIG